MTEDSEGRRLPGGPPAYHPGLGRGWFILRPFVCVSVMAPRPASLDPSSLWGLGIRD